MHYKVLTESQESIHALCKGYHRERERERPFVRKNSHAVSCRPYCLNLLNNNDRAETGGGRESEVITAVMITHCRHVSVYIYKSMLSIRPNDAKRI